MKIWMFNFSFKIDDKLFVFEKNELFVCSFLTRNSFFSKNLEKIFWFVFYLLLYRSFVVSCLIDKVVDKTLKLALSLLLQVLQHIGTVFDTVGFAHVHSPGGNVKSVKIGELSRWVNLTMYKTYATEMGIKIGKLSRWAL